MGRRLAKGGELGGEVGFYAGGVRMVRAYLDAPGNEHLQTPRCVQRQWYACTHVLCTSDLPILGRDYRLNKTLTTLMSLLDNYPVDVRATHMGRTFVAC